MFPKISWQNFRRTRLGTSYVLHAMILSATVLATVYIAYGVIPGWTFESASTISRGTVHIWVQDPGTVGLFTIYDLGTVAPGDSGTFQLVTTNMGEVTLDVAEPTATGLPAYLTVTFAKPPPQPGFPARMDPGESVSIDVDWCFDVGYSGPGDVDFSFTVSLMATQAL